MEVVKHENSKVVTIYRSRTFANEAQKGLEDFFAGATKSIGSYWESTNSKIVGSGLSITEQNILMPLLIDLPVEDREFRKKVKEFFEEMVTKVPYKDGVTLEIGLEESNDKKLSATNLPIKLMDYVRWRHASGHPEVARTRDEAEGNQLKKYYIYDPNTIKQKSNSLRDARDKAMEYYLVIKKDEAKVDNYLALLGEDPRAYADFDDKLEVLTKLVNSTEIEAVERFTALYEDPKTELKALVEKMVIMGILKRIGNRYLIAETDRILGDGLEEVLLELEDEAKNGELITVLKSQLQEKLKAKVALKRKAAGNARK